MSHHPQRKQKDCLNCGTEVLGRYCQNCGQENIEPKESVWHLVSHFFNDITHFDGKFFSSLKDVLFRPGFLSKEYMKGRRASYLNPVRMYIFTSFIFFLVFFSVVHINENQIITPDLSEKAVLGRLDKLSPEEFSEVKKALHLPDSMNTKGYVKYLDSLNKKKETGDTTAQQNNYYVHSDSVPDILKTHYKSVEEYDSLLKAGKIHDGWLKRFLIHKQFETKRKYGPDGNNKLLGAFITELLHSFPQLLFVSLPFVALFFQLLYIRRKEFFYVSHAIFAIHYYIFVFILMLFSMGVAQLAGLFHRNNLNFFNGIITLLIFFYLYKAMRNFYGQGRGKTLLKYFLFIFLFIILITFLFVIFAFISALKL